MSDSTASRPDTRAALIAAGLDLFGRRGFDAVSVRDLAAAAGANIAAVSYHFGGKDGLRRACAEAVVAQFTAALGGADLPDRPLPDFMAQTLLEDMLSGAVRALISGPGAAPAVAFLLREVLPDPTLTDIIYRGLFERMHGRLCALWGMATGADPDSPATLLRMFSLIGQIAYFRIGQPVVLRRMGWPVLGEDEAEVIRRAVTQNLRAMIAAERAERGIG